MKKLYSFLAGIVAIILVLWGIATHLDSKINSRDSQKLVIYNWGDYIDPELLEKFTEETITCKRPGNGISPMKWDEILGKVAEKDFQEDELIVHSEFEWQGDE